jgi:ribosomal protein L37E
MKNAFSFEFTTEKDYVPLPPKIISTNPANGSTDVPTTSWVTVAFSEAMNMTSTQKSISSIPPIVGTFSWNAGAKILLWAPSTVLQSSRKYTVTLNTDAKSFDGRKIASPYFFSFTTGASPDTTPPTVISTDPTNGQNDVDKNTKITITFSENMGAAATGNAVTISPGTITDKAWGNGTRTMSLTVALEDGKTYTVTVSTGAKDVAGNAMVSSYTFTFTTKSSAGGLGAIAMFLGLIVLIAIILVLLILALVRLKKRALCPECGEPYPKYTNVCSNCGYDFIRKTKKPLLLKEGKKAGPSITTAIPQERRPEEREVRRYPPIVPLTSVDRKKTDMEATKADEQPKARRMRLSSTKKTDIEISEEEAGARKIPTSRQTEDIAERRGRARERMLKRDKKEDIERSEEETEPRKTDDIAEKRRRAHERMLRRKRSS